MSREYLLYIEFDGIDEDETYRIFINYCGYSNIFQVNHMYDDIEGESSVYMYIKVHCTNSISVEEKMVYLKKLLEQNKARNVEMKCWSMNQQDCCGRLK